MAFPPLRRGRTVRRSLLAIGGLVAALAMPACGADADPPAAAEPTEAAPRTGEVQSSAVLTQVAKLPQTVTGFTATPDGEALIVGDRSGVIRRLVRTKDGEFVVPKLDEEPILDLSGQVSTTGERGFFDLEVIGDGRWLLVNYTALDGTITLERYPYTADGPIDPEAAEQIVTLVDPYSWHHGGGLALDPEGDLYLAIGDMEFRQLAPPGPQDPDLLLGGILRVPSAALLGDGGRWTPTPEDMVARGLRNPWRISLDAETGDLWIGEVGLADIEEVDRISADDLAADRQANFGWPYLEGSKANQAGMPEDLVIDDPVLERPHEQGTCGMVGGYVYRGTLLPDLAASYLYGDLCGESVRVMGLDAKGRVVDDRELVDLPEPMISFGEDDTGELYVLGSQGGVYRIDPPGWKVAGSAQSDDFGEVTTTVPRSSEDCDAGSGVVAAVEPLSDLGSLGPVELEQAITSANDRLAELVPTLPPYIYEDGMVVQKAFQEIALQLEAAGWDPESEALATLRADGLAGTGVMTGFAASMARIVDSECG